MGGSKSESSSELDKAVRPQMGSEDSALTLLGTLGRIRRWAFELRETKFTMNLELSARWVIAKLRMIIWQYSMISNCLPVSWSLWVHGSQADKLTLWMWEFMLTVGSAKVTRKTGAPPGYRLRSFNPSSFTAYTQQEFLFGFLALTSSILMPCERRCLSQWRAAKPGAGSAHIITCTISQEAEFCRQGHKSVFEVLILLAFNKGGHCVREHSFMKDK